MGPVGARRTGRRAWHEGSRDPAARPGVTAASPEAGEGMRTVKWHLMRQAAAVRGVIGITVPTRFSGEFIRVRSALRLDGRS
ncbi:hypothetical protein Airi02_005590 [Actinoallomurus iriomotensis]|uniref:Uncharacterized protein n=1 Tax=Actinoallomurus iriomotensis TaxID=478107 RepID=A0A9W6VXG5_9ACTN|nr:hypothetical protein Airi02_005590 [Actinoallomurus iriomotensis]